MPDANAMQPLITREIVASPAVQTPRMSRRGVLRLGFWTSLAALVASAGATLVNSLYPRKTGAFGGPVDVPAALVPRPGDPPSQNIDGHFLLVNLAAGEGRMATDETDSEGGLLALAWKCPHLGCTVPWMEQFVFDDGTGRRGWFRCPCHQSTYTKAGVRVFGPAPRSMDTMALSVDDRGNVVVQTGKVRKGDADNPQRALPWPRPT